MSSSSEGNPRNKVALKPGRSLMDWIRLTNSSAPGELSTGRRGSGNAIRDVSLEELARHNTKNDAWLALRGALFFFSI
jgi:cytochrome-b5 reductase